MSLALKQAYWQRHEEGWHRTEVRRDLDGLAPVAAAGGRVRGVAADCRRAAMLPALLEPGAVMLRLTEIGLFLLPFAVFGLCWWFGSLSPSPAMLAFAVVCLTAFAVYLVW